MLWAQAGMEWRGSGRDAVECAGFAKGFKNAIGKALKSASHADEVSAGCNPLVIAMSQAIIDPEEVRRFAAELKRFNGDLRERTASLMARFTALGDTWQDQEQEKFSGEFVQLMKTLKSFLELSERHTPYLLRKAERIQQYLDQR
jgi:uncharacterized protein YukE